MKVAKKKATKGSKELEFTTLFPLDDKKDQNEQVGGAPEPPPGRLTCLKPNL